MIVFWIIFIVFIIGMLYFIILSTKREKKMKSLGNNQFSHISGLPKEFDPNTFMLNFDEMNLIINHVNLKMFKIEVLQTFNIELRNIAFIDSITRSDLNNNSSAIAGAMLFGVKGAIIGNLDQNTECLYITYVSERNGEINNLIFKACEIGPYLKSLKFAKKLKKAHGEIETSQAVKDYLDQLGIGETNKNDDGSITL